MRQIFKNSIPPRVNAFILVASKHRLFHTKRVFTQNYNSGIVLTKQ
jgi:hypothetical protein